MNDTERLDWLEANHALLNDIPVNHPKAVQGTAHVCVSGQDPMGEDNRHYHARTYRAAIDKAVTAEALIERGERSPS